MIVSDFSRGNEFLRGGKLEEAVTAYQKAIAHDPSFHWYHRKLGETFENLGRWSEAIAAYQQAVKLNSNCSWSYYKLAMALSHIEQWQEAIANYKKAVKINPNSLQIKSSLNAAVAANVKTSQKLIDKADIANNIKIRKNVFWVASYPKSGNTWIRYILAHLLFKASENKDVRKQVGEAVPDMHYQKNIFDAPEINLAHQPKVSFAKTHTCGFPNLSQVKNVGFIYIYRHPLDVLISTINYSYISKNKNFFHDNCLYSVDQLKQNNQINWYVEKFMEDLKIDGFYKMSNTWLNHVNTWIDIAENHPMSIVVKYEDLLDNTFESLKKLCDFFDKTEHQIKESVEFSQKHTNDGGKFFWKKKSRNYEEYLDQKLITRFNSKYADILGKLGYDKV